MAERATTLAIKDKVREMRSRGASNDEIARAIGRSYSYTGQLISNMIGRGELEKVSKARKFQEHEIKKLARMIKSNKTVHECCKALSMNTSHYYKLAEEMIASGLIDRSDMGFPDNSKRFNKIVADYKKLGSLAKVAAKHGVTTAAIGQIMNKHAPELLAKPGRRPSSERKKRLKVVAKMVKKGGISRTEMASDLGVSMSTLTADIRELRDNGLIE